MALPQTVVRVGFKTLLVATDLSYHSQGALACAAALARTSKSELLIAHVISRDGWRILSPEDLHPALCNESRGVEKKLAHVLKSAALTGLKTDVIIKRGDFRPMLCEIAHERQADLLVLATHGRKGFRKLLLGSKVEEVCHRAPCPVLLVGPHARVSEHSAFERVLFATDLSPLSLAALPLVLTFASLHGSKLRIVRVVSDEATDDVSSSEFAIAQSRTEIMPIIATASNLAYKPEFHVAFGSEQEAILREANEWQADIVGIGAHRPSVLSVYLPGNLAYDVACDAQCPVMTIVD